MLKCLHWELSSILAVGNYSLNESQNHRINAVRWLCPNQKSISVICMILKLYIFTVSGRKSHPRESQLSPSKARCKPENKKTMTQYSQYIWCLSHLHVTLRLTTSEAALAVLTRHCRHEVKLVPHPGHHLGLEVVHPDSLPLTVAETQLGEHKFHNFLVDLSGLRTPDTASLGGGRGQEEAGHGGQQQRGKHVSTWNIGILQGVPIKYKILDEYEIEMQEDTELFQ